MFTDFLLSIFIFLIGVCIGSFLNCVIYRLEQKKPVTGRSFCPHCKHTLSWMDLFPVFSFLFLSGKCRYCKKKISIQYPLVELITGIIFLVLFNPHDIILSLFYIIMAAFLVVIFVYDLKHYLIPDVVLFPAIGIALLYDLIHFQHLFSDMLGVVAAAGFFLVIFLISKGTWMGFGDVKLAALMGLMLGFKNVLVALFLAFFFGAIIGVIMMAFRKKQLKSEIPFGPFLIAGTLVAALYGNQIIQWYLTLFQM